MRLRPLSAADLPACHALARDRRLAAGEAAWRLALAGGVGVAAEDGGRLGAVALLLGAGGMRSLAVLVAPGLERRGLGRAVAEAVLARGAAVPVESHAAQASVPFFVRLGFAPRGAAFRFVGHPRPAPPARTPGLSLRPIGGADFAGVAALDELAWGGSRRALLETLLPECARFALAVRDRRVVGYGAAWPDADAVAVGPLVAEDAGAALALAANLCASHERPVRHDVPAGAIALRAWAEAAGLQAVGSAARMVRGPGDPGRRERIHALASLAIG